MGNACKQALALMGDFIEAFTEEPEDMCPVEVLKLVRHAMQEMFDMDTPEQV